MKDLTAVLTNFRREQYLKPCLQSLRDSGFVNVVVTSSEPSPTACNILQECRPWFSDFRFTSVPKDLGNNEAWLRGVRLVKTQWVYLLHDDDVLLPAAFKRMWPRIRTELNNGRMPVWQGAILQGAKLTGVNDPLQGLPQGPHPSCAITERMHQPNAVSISPVLGIFTTAQMRYTLGECESFFACAPQLFCTRPNMMVGNDMLLWLHAAEQHPEIYRFAEPLSGHGHHAFSETVRAFNNPSALLKLRQCYANTQAYHRTHRYQQAIVREAIYHIVPGHHTQDPEVVRRNQLADASWAKAYAAGVTRLTVEPGHTPRNATTIGEKRDMPFVRDVFDYATKFAADTDWLVFTNRDICVSPELLLAVFNQCGDCFYSHRMDSKRLERTLKEAEIRQLRPYPGADLFAFKAGWWRKHRGMMPDMLVGFEAWDSVLWRIMDLTNGGTRADYTPLIYHEWHESHWEINKLSTPGQKHNRRLAKNFFKTRHGYQGNYE